MQFRNPYIEACIEAHTSVFKGLNQAEKELLDLHHNVVFYKKGEVVVSQGTKSRGLICLASGKVKLFRTGAGSREQIVRFLKPSDIINYKSIFSESGFPLTAVALEETIVVILERITISRLLKQSPDLAGRFIRAISEDLHFSDSRIISLTQKHVRGRLAETLLLLKEKFGTFPDGKTINVMLSREDIAHFSNMTTSNAIRTLSCFIEEKIISADGKKISILNIQSLEAISESGQ